MAGAMRRMGIYLGLVEDDDARGYGRYDARQSEHPDRDRRYGRYADDHYDDQYDDKRYGDKHYADTDYGYAAEALPSEEVAAVREPEPLTPRRAGACRPLCFSTVAATT